MEKISMKLDTLKHGFNSSTIPSDPLADYWSPTIHQALNQQD